MRVGAFENSVDDTFLQFPIVIKHTIKENCFDLDLRWNVKMEILKSGLYKQFTPNMSGSIPGP